MKDFYSILTKLLRQLNDMNTMDFERLNPIMAEMCNFLGIAKISATTYRNPKMELAGKGDELVPYDNGRGTVEVLVKRLVTRMMSVVVCRIYVEEGDEHWDEETKDRVDLFTDTVTAYMSRLRLQMAAERFAFFDDDGYHNLRYFIRCIEQRSQSTGLGGMAAFHFNLKHFSLVNQQVGRSAGSFVMRGFFDGLCELIGDRGEVCRMGGDNFVLLCEKGLVDQVVDYLKGTAVVYDPNSGERIMVTATAGVFIMPEDFIFGDTGDILDKIITSSTAARTGGKEDVVFFSESMVATKERVMRIQRLFPEAIRNEEFHVFYQPKIDINTGELIGAEALCRWFHDGRIVPPMEFIPVLEQGLDICKLDFYMLDHVCRDIRRWLDEGKSVVRISVNLSRKHMLDLDLLEHILEAVDRNNVPHQYVEIELTETTTDVEFRDLKRVVSGLQKAGISTSVDDFGMGYSSLNLIKEIPWNVLKVDRSFLPVDEDNVDSTRSVMFKYVVAMAREMGLECIAEGVETQAQVEVLRENSCELAQGFFFDKPLPVNDFEERLRVHKYKVE